MCVRGILAGKLSVGDAVLFLSLMNSLMAPLSFFGSYYRQVRQNGQNREKGQKQCI